MDTQRTFSTTDFFKSITVRHQFEGFHRYEDAPEEVAFLKHLHRHLFHIKCEIQVDHNDRELEFFMVKHLLEREILPYIQMAGDLGSCEQIGERIIEGLINAYGDHRFYLVEVFEDGENGATVAFNY